MNNMTEVATSTKNCILQFKSKLVLFLTLTLSGCGGIYHQKLFEPNSFRVTGSVYYANDEALNREALNACPSGYIKISEHHTITERTMIVQGSLWSWEIKCNSAQQSHE